MANETSTSGAGFAWEKASSLVCLLLLTASLLYVTGRPLFTDDAWWHLSLGRAYASSGPWLDQSPSLHTNRTAPDPHGWLGDLALHFASETAGLQGLRFLHVATVSSILVVVFALIARASRSRTVACTGTALFIVFSAYRLSQLRPELVTIGATLALYATLFECKKVPSWGRVAFAALLCGVWANLHPGFPLGPVLIATAAIGDFVDSRLASQPSNSISGRRAVRLAFAAILALGATLANPMGVDAYLPYFSSGVETPSLAFVADEWTPISPLRTPSLQNPPTPLAWAAYWLIASGAIWTTARRCREFHSANDTRETRRGPEGRSIALSFFGLLASAFAVRFLWLCILPLLALAEASRDLDGTRLRRPLAIVSILIVPAWFRFGDWPLLSSGVSLSTYTDEYDRWKYEGHSTRFLSESRLEGNLYNSYFMGGFLGYWLAPRLRTFIDGSLDVSRDVMDDYLAIQMNGIGDPGFDLTAALDRHQVDVFVGIGFPTTPTPGRPWRHTTMHLHDHPDWALVFRSMQSAVYLRRSERNRENFERVRRYYERSGLAFDPRTDLDVARIVDEFPQWAIGHGLVPRDFEQLLQSSRAPGYPEWVASRIATAYLAIGLDEQALALDESSIRSIPTLPAPRRRRIAALLRLNRIDAAMAEAMELERLGASDSLSKVLIETARSHAAIDEASRISQYPFIAAISRAEAGQLRALREPAALLTAPDRRAARDARTIPE